MQRAPVLGASPASMMAVFIVQGAVIGGGGLLLGVAGGIALASNLDVVVPAIEAIVRDLSVQCRLKIRRAYRWQAAGFYGSLGIGAVLPEHATLPGALAG